MNYRQHHQKNVQSLFSQMHPFFPERDDQLYVNDSSMKALKYGFYVGLPSFPLPVLKQGVCGLIISMTLAPAFLI